MIVIAEMFEWGLGLCLMCGLSSMLKISRNRSLPSMSPTNSSLPLWSRNILSKVSPRFRTASTTSSNSAASLGSLSLNNTSSSSSPIISLSVSKSELSSPFISLSCWFSSFISVSMSLIVTPLACISSITAWCWFSSSGLYPSRSTVARELTRFSPILELSKSIIFFKFSLCLWAASFESCRSFISSVSVFSSLAISSKISWL